MEAENECNQSIIKSHSERFHLLTLCFDDLMHFSVPQMGFEPGFRNETSSPKIKYIIFFVKGAQTVGGEPGTFRFLLILTLSKAVP